MAYEQYQAFATDLAQTVIEVVAQQQANFDIDTKPNDTLVTSLDFAVEQALRAKIESRFPDHGILGEELAPRHPDAEWIWVIDPIDGTLQFAAGLPNYGSLVALCHQGIPKIGVICQPGLKDIFLGITGHGSWHNGVPMAADQKANLENAIIGITDPDNYDQATRPGMERLAAASRWNVYDGGCLSFASLAAGRIGAAVYAPNVDQFDICALVPVVEGAGGVISDWQGAALTIASSGEIVASANQKLHEEVLALLNG